ncbi:MAG: QueT transporter family protein [Infirmifilum sp.]|uniref:QueT transporter family protein n=1 Tax=Infirmifilum TaxID=2856573 RepID=UPI003C732446
MESRKIALASLIASLYAILVYILPMTSFLLWQVRIADSLLPLVTVLGYPAVIGVSVGCFIGNILAAPWGSSGLNFLDALLGSLVNFVAGYTAYKLAYRRGFLLRVAAVLSQVIIVSIGVGSYLRWFLLWAFNTDVTLVVSIAGVLPGSLVSIFFLGLPLSLGVERALKTTGYRVEV